MIIYIRYIVLCVNEPKWTIQIDSSFYLLSGEQGWRSGDVVVIALASHLRGLGSGHEWVKLVVGSLLCSKRFFSRFCGFPLSSEINISKFKFNQMQNLPGNHFWVSGASRVNIIN